MVNATYVPRIVIVMPNSMVMPSTCTLSSILTISATSTCTVSGHSLIINSIFTTTYAGGNQIKFTIAGFTNAPSSGDQGIVSISTYLVDSFG